MTPTDRKKLFLIDGMSQIFRAFFALPPLATSRGLPTNAIRGFTAMLRRIIQQYQPDYLGVAFDLEGPTFRHEQFADYKKGRPEMPEDLAAQLPYIRKICDALNIPILQFEGFEADDVIGTLTKKAGEANLHVAIVTNDKDLFQLVDSDVTVLRTTREGTEEVFDAAKVEAFIGLPPEKIVDFLGLCGDKIDNIPGAPGIGEKGAVSLIQRFGSIEALLKRWDQVERKNYRESLRDNQEIILRSKELACIRTDVPIELDLETLKLETPNQEEVVRLFRELEFNTLLRDFQSDWAKQGAKPLASDAARSVNLAPSDPADKAAYRELQTQDEIESFLKELKEEKSVALAVQLDPQGTQNPFTDSIVSLGIATERHGGVEMDLQHLPSSLRGGLRAWLENPAISKQIHDAKLARVALAMQHGLTLAGVDNDTLLLSYLLDPNSGQHELTRVSQRWLQRSPGGSAAEIAECTRQLVAQLSEAVDQKALRRVYAEVELPLVEALAAMEMNGVKIDLKVLTQLSVDFEAQLIDLTRKIYDLAGTEFNINSPKQLGEILFEKMNLPAPKRSAKSGQYSTSVEVLNELAKSFEMPKLVLEYRQVSKLKSTYVDALPRLVNPRTGRLHTSFNQTIAATGRLSSAEPNLQNIPIRTGLGRKIRSAFVPEPGCLLLSADYSQIELRILAHLSEDPRLIEAFTRGEDIHARTAAEIFGVPPLMQTPDHRRRAKAINFGIIYGLSAFGLAQQIEVPQSEAKKYISDYFAKYQSVKQFLDRLIAEARRTGESRTLLGRCRPIPDIHSKAPALRSFAERIAMNTPLQGTAADLIKLAMIRIHNKLKPRSEQAKMILQVHDELVFEIAEEKLEEIKSLVKSEMENVYPLRVPLVVGLSIGKNWMDAK